MTKLKKRRFWIIVAVIALVVVAVLFSPLADSVTALFSDAHAVAVLWRVRNEIMQKSPAGQYYEAMFWKHNDELVQIGANHPENNEEFWRVTRMFIPGLEALLDGKGDTVRITKEQVNSLEAELDWISSFASPLLREDIEKEQERFPLENFVGMTMGEGLDFINSNWPPGLTPESIAPTEAATQTPQPIPTPICVAGFDSNCLTEPSLVPNSDGQWAYYVMNGIYFEYPSTWRVEGKLRSLSLLPTPDSSESSSEGPVYLFAWVLSGQLDVPYDPLTYPQTELQRPTPIWNRLVSLPDFTGSEVLWINSRDTPFIYVSAIFYIPSIPTTLEARMVFKNDSTNISLYDPDLFQEQYPNFRHIMESFRIWKP